MVYSIKENVTLSTYSGRWDVNNGVLMMQSSATITQ